MDEFQLKAFLKEKREQIKTFDDLVEFLKYVEENCNTGYGNAPRAIAQAALATAWYFAGKFGITGFQAGFVVWDFIFGWEAKENSVGMKLVDFSDMLFPQYQYKFEKTIPKKMFELLQKEAKKNLEEDRELVHPNVLKHWESIAEGEVPFGYEIKED